MTESKIIGFIMNITEYPIGTQIAEKLIELLDSDRYNQGFVYFNRK